MKLLQTITGSALLFSFFSAPLVALSADAPNGKTAEQVKPYTLKTCPVSDEKLGGDMGDPYVFTHEGREIKLCCKSCLKDFNKDSAKYLKKIEAAERKAKK